MKLDVLETYAYIFFGATGNKKKYKDQDIVI